MEERDRRALKRYPKNGAGSGLSRGHAVRVTETRKFTGKRLQQHCSFKRTTQEDVIC